MVTASDDTTLQLAKVAIARPSSDECNSTNSVHLLSRLEDHPSTVRAVYFSSHPRSHTIGFAGDDAILPDL